LPIICHKGGKGNHLKTIFVVDDSDTNLVTAEEALEDHFNVMTLPSAVKMFDLLEKVKPDLILLDIEMPEMDGFSALEQLKTGKWADVPVLFLTGTINDAIKSRSSSLGAVGIITKPFDANGLLKQINSHI
jgi:putative two-component system response regulator